MSKIVKGVKKAVKGVLKGAKKIFKEITKSTIGKILVAAAVIYFGGAALGAWDSGFAAVDGAFVAGTEAGAGGAMTAAETANAAATNAAVAESTGGALELGASDLVGSTVTDAATGNIVNAAGNTVAFGNPVAAADAAATQAATSTGTLGLQDAAVELAKKEALKQAGGSIIGNALTGIGTWAKANPALATMGGMAAMNAFSADEMDVQEAQEKELKRARNRANINQDVSGITIEMPKWNPQPIINSKVGAKV